MTDPTTAPPGPPGPPAPVPAPPDPVWLRLEADAAAFLAACPGPIPVARLVWETANLAYAQAVASVQMTAGVRPTPPPPGRIVADVMNYAAGRPGDGALAALHALFRAGVQARNATEDTPVVKDGGNCDG